MTASQAPNESSHQPVVAVIGGATAGAEVAARLADRGAVVVVFEQNPRPYGKIEDGLPRWHEALREKEYANIVSKLSRPGVHFVPNTKVGRDVGVEALAHEWGFSSVVLACGAWRDRDIGFEGSEKFIGKGLVYQNPFIIWFNHSHEEDYDGPTFEPEDGVLVVGGGLASIDVAKVLMLETTRRALAERGIETTILELEVKGIPKLLAAHDLAFEDLGLEGSTIVYRRRPEDMPLMEAPEGADEKRLEKVRKGRQRMLDKAMEKYRFKIEPLSMTEGPIEEDGRLVGLKLRRTRIENGRVVPADETFELRGRYVVSSIGSIPEPMEGIPMKGELFEFSDWEVGRIDGFPTLYSVGNVVTGKGNIVASRKHAAAVSEQAIERFLGIADDDASGGDDVADAAREAGAAEAEAVAQSIEKDPGASAETAKQILERVAARQKEVGYPGDLATWIEQVKPTLKG